eukprot:Selendium_serpulae@DN5776_c0_g1_i1.p1
MSQLDGEIEPLGQFRFLNRHIHRLIADTDALVRFGVFISAILVSIFLFNAWRNRASEQARIGELSESERVATVRRRQQEKAKKDAEDYVPSEEYKVGCTFEAKFHFVLQMCCKFLRDEISVPF